MSRYVWLYLFKAPNGRLPVLNYYKSMPPRTEPKEWFKYLSWYIFQILQEWRTKHINTLVSENGFNLLCIHPIKAFKGVYKDIQFSHFIVLYKYIYIYIVLVLLLSSVDLSHVKWRPYETLYINKPNIRLVNSSICIYTYERD